MSDLRNAAQQALEALIENARLLGGTQAKKGFGCYSQKDANLERAWHEGIAKHSATIRAALAQQAEPAQPVAWMCPDDPERETAFHWQAGHCDNCGKQRIPLYTAPPQRKPLTDEELDALAIDEDGLPNSHLEFARAIERAHGIGEGE